MAKETKHEGTKPNTDAVGSSNAPDPVLSTSNIADSDDPNDLVDDDQDRSTSPREALMRGGLLRALAAMPGAECHSIHQRLAEMLPFFPIAISTCDGSLLGDALEHLERFIRGEG